MNQKTPTINENDHEKARTVRDRATGGTHVTLDAIEAQIGPKSEQMDRHPGTDRIPG